MSNYDNTINNILKNLIFEQDENFEDIENIIKATREEIKKNIDERGSEYELESQRKYETDDGFLNKLEELAMPYLDQLKEDIDWQGAWNKTKEMAKAAAEKIGPPLAAAGDIAADKIGEIATNVVGQEFIDNIQNNLSESFWYKIAAVFEPTGIMSWPYYRNALDLYEQNKGTDKENIYFLNLLAAQISVIPGVRLPVGILTAPFKLLTRPIGNIFGSRREAISKGIADYTRSRISKNPMTIKAADRLSKKKITGKAVNTVKNATKAVAQKSKDIAKKVAKATAAGAKTATVIGSGDIPKTWEDWGKDVDIDKIKPRERTLGSFPRFGEISTQSF